MHTDRCDGLVRLQGFIVVFFTRHTREGSLALRSTTFAHHRSIDIFLNFSCVSQEGFNQEAPGLAHLTCKRALKTHLGPDYGAKPRYVVSSSSVSMMPSVSCCAVKLNRFAW